MRRSVISVWLAIAAVFGGFEAAHASFFSMPRLLGAQIQRLRFNGPALPPMAHTIFCINYPADCAPHKIAFRGGGMDMTSDRWQELVKVNTDVNRAIKPQPNLGGLATEKWVVAPARGECHDYAVTKQHDLLAKGWPSRALLLAEVVTSSGEHHLVLVVRTHDGDFVADNLNYDIRPLSRTTYAWVRVQTPANPQLWATVGRTLVSQALDS
jgi:predicted transglutaminase-like cysteine proteinase